MGFYLYSFDSYDERLWCGQYLLQQSSHPYRFYLAQIISGFISFGTLHIKTQTFKPWQW